MAGDAGRGRDARLTGGALRELGDRIDAPVELDLPQPRRRNARTIEGQIIHVNRFGSLITNIHGSMLDGLEVTAVVAGSFPVGDLARTYADVDPGKPLALIGSSQYLEIAYRGDRADTRLHLGVGIGVSVSVEPARA